MFEDLHDVIRRTVQRKNVYTLYISMERRNTYTSSSLDDECDILLIVAVKLIKHSKVIVVRRQFFTFGRSGRRLLG